CWCHVHSSSSLSSFSSYFFFSFFFLVIRPPPSSTLFPYTTLFRSCLLHSLSRFALLCVEWSYRKIKQLPIKFVLFLHGPRYSHQDRKSTRLNSSHVSISYAVFCLKKKNKQLLLYTR